MYGRGEGPGGGDAHPGDHGRQHRVLTRSVGGGPGRELNVLSRGQRGQQNGLYVGRVCAYICRSQHDIL